MSSKGQSHNKFLRFITVPFRALGKATDLYVRSMTSCASRANLGQGCGDDYYSGLPRSFSTSSATSSTNQLENEDFRELIRAASVRSLGHRNEMELFLQEQLKQMRSAKGSTALPKSCSVGMGRIDEDKPCDEFEDKDDDDVVVAVHVGGNNNNKKLQDQKKKQDSLFKRSRSYAVTKRSSVSFDSY